MQGTSEIFRKRSVNCFKNSMSIGVRRAAAKSSDFFFPVRLRSPVINGLKNMINVLILISVAGCSFHSAQWESAKALWALRAPVTKAGNETYWWDMEHGGETFRLFPVAWDGKTVLTDGNRWMIVLNSSEITMIRDFQTNQQITFEDLVDPLVGAGEMVGDSDSSSRYSDSSYSGASTRIAIVESPIGKPMESVKTKTSCLPSRFDSQSLRLITRCFSGEQDTDLRVAEFDQSGNILGLQLNLLSNKTWAIYRSDDLVDAFEVKRYLDGDVDEI